MTMLKELAEIEGRLGDKGVNDVRAAANTLLRRQFLYAGDRGATHAYEAVTGTRLRPYFIALFDALGYDLRWNEVEQWVGILPASDLDLFHKMKAEQTITLLVLALTWQEEVNRGAAGERATVTVTMNDLFERYRDVVAGSRREALSVARLEDALKDFQRRSLVTLGPYDPDAHDREVEIRPMVHLLVDGGAIDRLERFASEAEARIDRLTRAKTDMPDDTEDEDDQP